MTLQILVDECLQSAILVGLLKQAGHDVSTANDEGLTTLSDSMVFQRAIERNRIILTNNCIDFIRLAESLDDYPGLLLVYSANEIKKDMSLSDIVRAIANLEASQIEIRNHSHNLNHWK